MKKVFFLLAFLFALGTGAVNAQCSAASAGTAVKPCCMAKAAKAAAADPSIEKRTSDDGSVSYVRKEVDAQGTARFVSVKFDEGTNTFVNVAPKGMTEADKTGMVKKSTCTAGSGTKACCAGGANKACCASKAATGTGSTSSSQQ